MDQQWDIDEEYDPMSDRERRREERRRMKIERKENKRFLFFKNYITVRVFREVI